VAAAKTQNEVRLNNIISVDNIWPKRVLKNKQRNRLARQQPCEDKKSKQSATTWTNSLLTL
jgi:hypothetical protein